MENSQLVKKGRLMNSFSLVFFVLTALVFFMDIGTLVAPLLTWTNGEESAFGPAYRFASGGMMWFTSLLLNVLAIFVSLGLQLTRFQTLLNEYPVGIVFLFAIAAEFYRLFALAMNTSYISEDVAAIANNGTVQEPRLLHVSRNSDLSMGPGGQMSIVASVLGLFVIPLVPLSLFKKNA